MRRGLFFSVVLLVGLSSFAQAQDPEFPKHGFLPKKETGALRFLETNPKADGRGVVVAIFDTGVDPGAPGLQLTSDGKPKIVDVVDGSGSGDVDTSTIQTPVKKKYTTHLTGLSGRKLLIPKSWKNPTGKFRLGLKRGYDLFPSRLIPRVRAERKAKWQKNQARLSARIASKIRLAKLGGRLIGTKASRLKELNDQLAMVSKMTYRDPGPVFDCVVFHDGRSWQAAVDTDEDGNFGDEKLMTDYRKKRQYASFGSSIMLNFALNIYNNGNLLSIVTDCGVHGTHVAGIVAAHFKDKPELNGIAPGAQIVSVKIGDHRLGSSSTNTGQIRGLATVLQNRCDLINMSYGGASDDPNRGNIVKMYSELVHKKKVIFVASAGNSGPCLSTVGSPGGTTSALIGVGAYVSPELAKASYSLSKNLKQELPYTWTSRGPTNDGDLGVNICAPGGAFAPVSKWSLDKMRLLNGTSMSSPNACGGIALIVSGLKQKGIKYTPSTMLRALQNTARPLKDHEAFGAGRGLIQIDAAYRHLVKFAKLPSRLMRYTVALPDNNNARGIYLRDPVESSRPYSTRVQVRPVFPSGTKNKDRADFEARFVLKCDAEWVTCPKNLLMTNQGRMFRVGVDPTKLKCGVYYTEVIGLDATKPDRGAIFRVPITVVCPERLKKVNAEGKVTQTVTWRKKLKFKPGQVRREFICIPRGATWVDLHVRAGKIENGRTMVVHAIEQTPRTGYPRNYHRHYISLKQGREASRSFAVTGGHTLELCLAQYWSNLDEGEFEFELNVHGLSPDANRWSFDGSRLTCRMEVVAPLREEQLSPVATLTRMRKFIRPVSAVVTQLKGRRDQYPRRRIYQLVLTYEFEMADSSSVNFRPSVSREDESWQSLQSQLWAVYDSNKMRLATGTAGRSVSLRKGKYTLQFHVRHTSRTQLNSLRSMYLAMDKNLKRSISLPVFRDPDGVLTGSDKYTGGTVACGTRQVLYIGMPKSFAGAAGGDRLLGSVVLGRSNNQLRGRGSRPGGFPLEVVVPTQPVRKSSSKSGPTSLSARLWQAQFAHLQMLREQQKRKEFKQLAAKLATSYKQYKKTIDIETLMLADDLDRKRRLPEVVRLCDAFISKIDTTKMAAHYGVRLNPEDKKAASTRRAMDKQKAFLADLLYRKARAVAFMDLPYTQEEKDWGYKRPPFPTSKKARTKLFEQTYAELLKWVDVTGTKYALLAIRRYRRLGRHTEALKLLNKHMGRVPSEYRLYKKRADIYKEMGWSHWERYERVWMSLRFQKKYQPF